MVVGGCIIAGIGDFAFDLKGQGSVCSTIPCLAGFMLSTGRCCWAAATDTLSLACRYFFALSSCFLQASYLLLVEHSGEAKGVGTSELMVYNALWSVPGIFLVSQFGQPTTTTAMSASKPKGRGLCMLRSQFLSLTLTFLMV